MSTILKSIPEKAVTATFFLGLITRGPRPELGVGPGTDRRLWFPADCIPGPQVSFPCTSRVYPLHTPPLSLRPGGGGKMKPSQSKNKPSSLLLCGARSF